MRPADHVQVGNAWAIFVDVRDVMTGFAEMRYNGRGDAFIDKPAQEYHVSRKP